MKQIFIADVMIEVAKFIMSSSLVFDMPDSDKLQTWADGSSRVFLDFSCWYLRFCRRIDDLHDAEATLLIEVKEYGDSGLNEDEEGNLWGQYKVFARVSWPTYGDCAVEIASARIQLMAEVCRLAKTIEEQFSEPIHQIACKLF